LVAAAIVLAAAVPAPVDLGWFTDANLTPANRRVRGTGRASLGLLDVGFGFLVHRA
jgi:hypothetical protein